MINASKDPVEIKISIQQPVVTRYAFYTVGFISESDTAQEYVEVSSLKDVLDSGYSVGSAAYVFCNILFSQTNRPESAILISKKTTESYAQAYSRNRTKDYYFLVLETKNINEILEVSTLVNSLNDYKLIFFSTTEDVTLQVTGIDNLVWWYFTDYIISDNGRYVSSDTDFALQTEVSIYPEAAILGRCANNFPSTIQWSLKELNDLEVESPIPNYYVGTQTWKFDSLSVMVWDNITTQTEVALQSPHIESFSQVYELYPLANYYAQVLDTPVTWGSGTTTAGEWIDIKVFTDWMKWAIQQRIWKLLKTSLKVPATEQGAEQIKLCLKEVLDFSVQQQGIEKYEIKKHILNRSSRSLSINFNFSYSHSINAVQGVTGYLTF